MREDGGGEGVLRVSAGDECESREVIGAARADKQRSDGELVRVAHVGRLAREGWEGGDLREGESNIGEERRAAGKP